MELLFFGVLLLIFIKIRNSDSKNPVQKINQQWVDYVAAYYNLAKNNHEQRMLRRMLDDLRAQGMPLPTVEIQSHEAPSAKSSMRGEPTAELAGTPAAAQPNDGGAADWTTIDSVVSQGATVSGSSQLSARTIDAAQQAHAAVSTQTPSRTMSQRSIDNTTVLLYFGAFLFLLSAGLFVGYSGFDGWLRTLVLAATAALLYSGGLRLRKKPKLRSAAYTFTGIGLMLAPFVGLAVYTFVVPDYPAVIWFATSLLCFGLYGHALHVLKNPLVEYLFIGTFVSLFESAVSVLRLPIYYYGWMLTLCALLLQLRSLRRGQTPHETTPAVISAVFMVPLSVGLSTVMLARHGSFQLGVTLLLTAVFYGLEAYKVHGNRQATYVSIAQLVAHASVVSMVYAFDNSFTQAAVVLLAVGGMQVAWLVRQNLTRLVYLASNGALGAIVLAALLAWNTPLVMCTAVLCVVAASWALWLCHRRNDMFLVGGMSLVTVPYVVGLHLAWPLWPAWLLTAAVYVVTAFFSVLPGVIAGRAADTPEWRTEWRDVQFLAGAAVIGTSYFANPWTVLSAGVALGALSLYNAHSDAKKAKLWLITSSVVVTVPLLLAWSQPVVLLIGALAALVWHGALARTRGLVTSQVAAALLWLGLPVVVARALPAFDWPAWYAASYLVTAAGFVWVLLRVIRPGQQGAHVKRERHVFTEALCRTGFLAALIGAFYAALLGGDWVVVGVGSAAAAQMLGLSFIDTQLRHWWRQSAGMVVAVAPLLFAHANAAALLSGVAGALVWHIVIDWKFRAPLSRWSAAALWLILPVVAAPYTHTIPVLVYYAGAYYGCALGLAASYMYLLQRERQRGAGQAVTPSVVHGVTGAVLPAGMCVASTVCIANAGQIGPWQLWSAVMAVAAMLYAVSCFDRLWQQHWRGAAGVMVVVLPLLFASSTPTVLLVSMLTALLWHVVMIVRHQLLLSRLMAAGLALFVLPWSFAYQFSGLQAAWWYASVYALLTVVFVVLRARARLPAAVTVYRFAYITSTAGAVIAACFADVYGTFVCAGLALVCAVVALKIERLPDGMYATPLLLQLALWPLMTERGAPAFVLTMSTVCALGCYMAGWIWSRYRPASHAYGSQLMGAAVRTAYVAPLLGVFQPVSWFMPVGLGVAGAMTLHAVWNISYAAREVAGGVIVLAVLWGLYVAGVRNIQVYSHTLVAVFGLYAYLRQRVGDTGNSQNYLFATIATASIPLGFQALYDGNSSELYSRWFLAEQIAIMLLGMHVRNRIVMRWGLYAALCAVLYQLRSLAWLSLTLLGLFLIGLAVYRLQKNEHD